MSKIKRPQIYEIYINGHLLTLAPRDQMEYFQTRHPKAVHSLYFGSTKLILQHVDRLEKAKEPLRSFIYSDHVKSLWKEFKALFVWVRAGGGLVYDDKQRVLMIFRRGHWDLPKGKLDPEEKYKSAALREVMEETGVKKLELKQKLGTRYHLFRNKTKTRILKKTKWYRMETTTQKLTPEKSEGIVKAEWVSLKKSVSKSPIYAMVAHILEREIKKRG